MKKVVIKNVYLLRVILGMLFNYVAFIFLFENGDNYLFRIVVRVSWDKVCERVLKSVKLDLNVRCDYCY